MADKKQEFVVSDRRRFAPEGELRTDVPVQEAEEEKPAAPAAPSTAGLPSSANAGGQPADFPATSPEAASAPPSGSETAEEPPEEIPEPPTAQEQQAQTDAYKASGKKLDDLFSQTTAGQRRAPVEMTFERLVESFYMTALFQLGALRQEGESPAVDIIGARQTIDSLTLMQEKTKGNLTEREQNLLQNILFELRMAWIEITNAIASGALAKPGAGGPMGPPGGIKK